ncbi:MAG: M56 family metallopeptidase [Candidatus Levybacteria bacterium]|nr:M56 family metallopeptidase [Candidatus Levybacteria bacterium]
MLVLAIKLLMVYVKVSLFRKKLIENVRSNIAFNTLLKKLDLTAKTYLVESEKQFAFCLGIRKPKIYVSNGLLAMLTTQEMEAVLRHEQYHLNNRDTFIMLIASISESLLPFFPLISDLLHNYRIEREIKADAEAIGGLGSEKPLISVLKKLLNTPSLALATTAAIADQDTLEPRIRALVKKDFHFKKFKAKHIFISILSVFVMSIITFAPVQAVEVNHMGENVMMICPNDNECLNACRQEYSANKKNYSEDRMYTPVP